MHPGPNLGKWPTWCTITLYNTFLITVTLYMFWATLCSSSGGQIVLIQYLVQYSVWPSRVQVEKFLLNLHAGRSLTENTIGYINTIWPPDDEHGVARNMYRIIIINALYNVLVHQVGHLPRAIGKIHFNLPSLRHMLFACYYNFYTQAQLEVIEKVQ